MASTLGRIVEINDDGTWTKGTLRDAAWTTSLYDSLENAFAMSTPYVPTWGNTGTANTLGNGTIVGAYWQFGKYVRFRLKLTWGSTTSSGNGEWTFTLPVTSDGEGFVGSVIGVGTDTSAVSYYKLHAIDVTTSSFRAVGNGAPMAGVTSTSPFTWANTDTAVFKGWYVAA